jgi:hypothetical protein
MRYFFCGSKLAPGGVPTMHPRTLRSIRLAALSLTNIASVDRLLLQGIEVHPQKQVGCQGVFAAVRRSDKPAPTRSSGVDQSSSLIGNT